MHAGYSSQEVADGLRAARASVPPKYLYDELGSRLFELITRLPEYYPTRLETALIASHADDIADIAGTTSALIDLGAGNCEKARLLFPSLRPAKYVAVDISADFLDKALEPIQRAFPHIETFAVGGDMATRIDLPASLDGMRRIFFFPGSSIGNLDPDDAMALLSRIHDDCRQRGGLLIGIDLVKDSRALNAAYNDALGLTAAFNRNLLNHLNALLDADFRLSDWCHQAFFNVAQDRIEMHLQARTDVTVTWPGAQRRFAAGERIHTENSYKYRLDDFKSMLERAGFRDIRAWTDARQWFAVCYADA
jgi:dimethylhistidine N-methyltransferase